jgi:hypothetical protein
MLPKANIMTMKREFSLAEGNAIALKINRIKPIIRRNDGRKRLFFIIPPSQLNEQ